MKRIYLLFLAIPVLIFTLLYLSIWWSVGIVSAIMIFIAYRYFNEILQDAEARNEVLEHELDELHIRLENAVIKEQKTGRDADQVRQSKQQLLSVISHEIRTPMNGVIGTTLLLADTPLSQEQQDYVSVIRSCSEGLLTTVNNLLVNDMLDYSKLQQESRQLEYKDFDLRDSVEEVLELFAERTGKSGVELLYDMDNNVPVHVIGDNKRLRQVLINLIENAVKNTNRGEIIVSTKFSLHDAAGNPPQLHFAVQDTGTGIEKDQLRHIFKGIPGKEAQKDNGSETSGLGLVICKKLVELMGGSIEVKSEPGVGSTFSFTIPFTPSLKAPKVQQQNISVLEGKRILIVDDNAASCSILMKQMQTWKMLPITANSIEQAMDTLSKTPGIDLILSDINMGKMDGLVKAAETHNSAIRFIAMVAAGNDVKPQAELFSAVINKPVRRFMLLDRLVAALTPKESAGAVLSDVFAEKYPLHILVAEDNLVNQKIATKILKKLGYEPDLASNGKEAVELAGDHQYDIILMDVQMPQMDGLEATRMLRTCLEVQPVVIALTANAMQGDRDECMQAGMDDYMSKPIDLKELLRQLEKWSIELRERRKLSI
jgi:signal transduction histidine kinase/CheY-like chemotaxis protein